MKTLFVTSFGPDLYQASGKRLVESFTRVHLPTCPADRLLCCVEGYPSPADDESLSEFMYRGVVNLYDLDGDKFLGDWLKANADIIPDYLGGTATKCDCPNTEARHAKHRHGCHWQWMNRNASRWFRKVASLCHASNVCAGTPYDFLVWLDADAYFKAPLPHKYLAKKLKTADMFYFRGHRPGVESGILAFKGDGLKFIAELCRRYVSGDFRKDERWDDGYQIARVLDTCPTLKAAALDLVHPTRYGVKGPERTNNVIPTTDIAEFLVHEKGRHGNVLGIML